MSTNMHSLRAGQQPRALPGKGRTGIALSGAFATIKKMARVCADSWAFAHRTRHAMGFSDEAGSAIHTTDD